MMWMSTITPKCAQRIVFRTHLGVTQGVEHRVNPCGELKHELEGSRADVLTSRAQEVSQKFTIRGKRAGKLGKVA